MLETVREFARNPASGIIPTQPFFRPGTQDSSIFTRTFAYDEYDILGMKIDPKDVFIDVGSHIGGFIVCAARAGAGFVLGVEADPANWELARWNVAAYLGADKAAQRTAILEGACWRSDSRKALEADEKHWTHAGYETNTGGGGMCPNSNGKPCKMLPFDDIVDTALTKSANGRIRLVKMDCEGAEYPSLYTSRRLELIDEIRMEYHEGFPSEQFGPRSADDLVEYLKRFGFKVDLQKPTDKGLGLLFLYR